MPVVAHVDGPADGLNGVAGMDPKALKEQALAETARHFLGKFGAVPAEDSEEWEEEYRRQFNRLKSRAATGAPAASPSTVVEEKPVDLPDLVGTPADARWAFALRTDRLKRVPDRDLRTWLAQTWVRSKDWINSRELSDDAFRRRVEPSFREAGRKMASEAAVAAAARQTQEAAATALQDEIAKAGISAAGLLELIDLSPRVASLPLKEKLVEIHVEERTVRVFETANPGVLMVLEKRVDEKIDYGIERDEGLVADLKLFARSGL